VAQSLARTPLYDWHAAHGARLVDFAGWEMPVQYTSIVTEHVATRTACTLFDVSHMARFRFRGAGSRQFLDSLLTRRISDIRPGQIRYSLVTNETGGILDDVLVYCLPVRGSDAVEFAMVVNASNRAKIANWFQQHLIGQAAVEFTDRTIETAMIAVQGPKAIALAQKFVDHPLEPMKYYTGAEAAIDGAAGLVSRTGYTGEDGVELVAPAASALALWTKLIDAGASAAGLGARDTLRLEGAMPLYGHELNEQIDPVQAGLNFAINLQDRTFPGRDAIAARKEDPTTPRRIGLTLASKRVPREGFAVLAGDKTVGSVTSGTFSPTLDQPIAMAYVDPQHSASGSELAIDIRGRAEPARVVDLPFYTRRK
jgi:aminomethyltransferase